MKVVVLDGYTENPGDLSWEGLERLGELTVYDRAFVDKITERIGDTEAVYTNKTPTSAQTIGQCPNSKFIGALVTGYNVVDTAVAKAAGAIVSNILTYSTDVVTQHAIALLLELRHHIGEHSDCVKTGEWTHNTDWCFWKHLLVELAGKAFGVIGFGRIGQGTVKIAEALGMRVLVYDEHPDKALEIDNYKYAPLDQLLAQTDVISLHCPLFPSTEGIINRNSIAEMKDGVKIVNTSRGSLIVEKDLREALDSGKVNGVAADVVSIESIREDNPLLGIKNMIIIPHVARAPRESKQRLMDTAMDNLKHSVDGVPQNMVNKQQENQTACSVDP